MNEYPCMFLILFNTSPVQHTNNSGHLFSSVRTLGAKHNKIYVNLEVFP